ncbi:MAG: metallophosphoesterase [Bacteroidetes bacterium]|nr:metallophosphoesterase [Bacteroidota bacterium]
MKIHSVLSGVIILFSYQILCAQKSTPAKSNAPAQNSNFSFVAFGDMPYFLPEDFARFDTFTHFINAQNQAFNLFVGDIKSSSTLCSDSAFTDIYRRFSKFEKPLIYTPGDNEWTDCHKSKAGAYDPDERLSKLREIFFTDSFSMGKNKMPLQRQSDFSIYKDYVENAFWNYGKISFVTLHIVGSNNHLIIHDGDTNTEFKNRFKADTAWIHYAVKQAEKNQSLGLVFVLHADMFTGDKDMEGFEQLIAEFKRMTIQFGKPVLLIHGDSHRFVVDKPLFSEGEKVLLNFTRLQVFGEHDMHSVRIKVNTTNPSVFEIEELWTPFKKQ